MDKKLIFSEASISSYNPTILVSSSLHEISSGFIFLGLCNVFFMCSCLQSIKMLIKFTAKKPPLMDSSDHNTQLQLPHCLPVLTPYSLLLWRWYIVTILTVQLWYFGFFFASLTILLTERGLCMLMHLIPGTFPTVSEFFKLETF